MNIPCLFEADRIICEAESLNPGPWVSHSRGVSYAAQLIAAEIKTMDIEAAAVLGLLHDIGRRQGVTGMRHVIDGYHFLMDLNYPEAARISLTHSYPNKIAVEGSSVWDGNHDEYNFVQSRLDQMEFNQYDRLIQLCDALALPNGFCLIEQRFVDVVMRYGFSDYTIPKWRALLKIKAEIEMEIGKSVYDLFPGFTPASTQADQNFYSPVNIK